MNDRKLKVTGTMGALSTSRSSTNLPAYSFAAGPRGRTSCPFDTPDDIGEEAFNEDCAQKPGKKKRLTLEQVKSLETSFDLVNKLKPERRMQMANELGLEPKQVAIWFQNRRARWKTKQLEKDYDALKSDYDSLKTKYDSLLQDKEKIREQMLCLKEKIQLAQSHEMDEANALELLNGECGSTSRSWRGLVRAEECVDDEGEVIEGRNNNMMVSVESNFIVESSEELLWDWES